MTGAVLSRVAFGSTLPANVRLAPSGFWNGTAGSGWNGSVPVNPVRVTAKPAANFLVPNWITVTDDFWVVADVGANGGVAAVIFTLEGGAPITVTSERSITFTDANGLSRSLFGYAAQIDLAACLALNANGAAKISMEAVANDATMQHRIGFLTVFPRTTEFTDTVNCGSGQTYTTLKAALNFARTNPSKRVKIVLTDSTDYKWDTQDVDYTGSVPWTVIVANAGVNATLGDASNSITRAGFAPLCVRGSGVTWNLAKLSYNLQGYRFGNGGARLWLDGCKVRGGTPDPAHGGSGTGAAGLLNGGLPDIYWLNGNDAPPTWEVYFTEVDCQETPAYGLSFYKLRRHCTVDMASGSDSENTQGATYGGYSSRLGGYWSTVRTQQGAFDLTGPVGGAYEKVGLNGYSGAFNGYSLAAHSSPDFSVTITGSTTVAQVIAAINATWTGFHATATASANTLGAPYISRADIAVPAAIPKTTFSGTAHLTRIADVHADCLVWTSDGTPTTYENITCRFYGQRQAVGVDFFSQPADEVIAKDWVVRNYTNQDISATYSEGTQPGVVAGTYSHLFMQYNSDANPSGLKFGGNATFDTYCSLDHTAGVYGWTSTVRPNLTFKSVFFQQTSVLSGSDANCKASNVATSTLYVGPSLNPPNFTPLATGLSVPLRLADLTYAGSLLPSGAEQGT